MYKSLSAIPLAAAAVQHAETLQDLTLLTGADAPTYAVSEGATAGTYCDLLAADPIDKDWSQLDLVAGDSWADNADYDGCYCAGASYDGTFGAEREATWTATLGDVWAVKEVQVLSDADGANDLDSTEVVLTHAGETYTCAGGGAAEATWYTYDCAAGTGYATGVPATVVALAKTDTAALLFCGIKILAYQPYDAWAADLDGELWAAQAECDDLEVDVGAVTQALTSLDTDWAELYEAYGTLYDNYELAQSELDAAQIAFNGATATFNALDADFVAAQSAYTDLVADYSAASVLSGEKEATLVSYEDRAVAPKCLFGVLGWYMYCREFDEIDGEEEDAEEEAE